MSNTDVFKGKVALISGAGSGIGLELAREFGRCGATVIGTDINQARVDELVKTLTDMGCTAKGYRVDHSSREEVEDLLATITADVGSVDILCPNAGVGHVGKIGSIPDKEWQWVFDINVWGVVHMVELFVPSMIQRKSGWVMITASGAALCPSPGMAPYNLSKFAVLGLGETMYMELKMHGIDVSVLCPGIIATNIIKDGIVHGGKNKQSALEIYGENSARSVHPSIVAHAAVAGLAAGKPVIRTPFSQVGVGDLCMRIARTFFLNIGARLFKKGQNFIGSVAGNE
jgi:short-subunit dehydrogenase